MSSEGFFSEPHGASVHNGHNTFFYFEAFGSGAVTTCFDDLGLSRQGFERPTFRLRGQRSNPLRHKMIIRGFLLKQVIEEGNVYNEEYKNSYKCVFLCGAYDCFNRGKMYFTKKKS